MIHSASWLQVRQQFCHASISGASEWVRQLASRGMVERVIVRNSSAGYKRSSAEKSVREHFVMEKCYHRALFSSLTEVTIQRIRLGGRMNGGCAVPSSEQAEKSVQVLAGDVPGCRPKREIPARPN
jgi:hypothetical protein